MKKFLLLIAVMLTQTLSAQVYSGESDAFWVPFGCGESDKSKSVEVGFIKHYIGTKGESTYFKILIPSIERAIDISKNNNVRIEYNDGSYLKTHIHSAEIEKLSKPYARERFYGTIVEFPIEKSELCSKKRLRVILIERDCGQVHTIDIGKFWALRLNKEFNAYFTQAEERALMHMSEMQLISNQHNTPSYIKEYLEDNYPECSYSLTQLDTVYLPIRSIMLLGYSVAEAHEEFVANMDNSAGNYAQTLEHGDSLVKEFKEKLNMYEKAYKYPRAATGSDDDYQRATLVLRSYEGTDSLTLYTRVGEESFIEFDFYEEADECSKIIEDFEVLINQLHEQQEK